MTKYASRFAQKGPAASTCPAKPWRSRKLTAKSGIIHLLPLVLLLLGLAAVIYLVQNQQIFGPRASEQAIVFLDTEGAGRVSILSESQPQTISPNIKIQLTSPFGPPEGQGLNIVKEVHAQTALSASITGPVSGTVGQSLTFTSTAQPSGGGTVAKNEMYITKDVNGTGTAPEGCTPFIHNPMFCFLGGGNTLTHTTSFTPITPGVYKVAVLVMPSVGVGCSGNPYVTFPDSGFNWCGANSVLTVKVTAAGIIAPLPPASGLSATITGPTSGIVGQTLTFTSTAQFPDNDTIVRNDIFITKEVNGIGTAPEGCTPHSGNPMYCFLGRSESNTNTVSFTPTTPGIYKATVLITSRNGLACSSNPYITYPFQGITYCGTEGLVTANILAEGASPANPISQPVNIFTTGFKIAESESDLGFAELRSYTSHPTVIDYEFKDKQFGTKFIFVDFISSDGRTERKSAQINYVDPSQPVVEVRETESGASCGKLYVQVSKDKEQFSDSVNFATADTKYYVKAVRDINRSTACSTNFEVRAAYCDKGGSCGAFGEKQWTPFYSGTDGIARIDFTYSGEGEGYFKAQLRPYGSNAEWSNEFRHVMDRAHSPTSSERIDMTQYHIYEPGYTWIYNTNNKLASGSGITRVQIEEETEFCGVNIKPWRYTKDSTLAYWGPAYPNSNNPGHFHGGTGLRWLVVSKDFSYNKYQNYNNYIWAWGDKRSGVTGIKDFNLPTYGGYQYQSKTARVPSYNLTPKTVTGSYLDFANGEIYSGFNSIFTCNDPANAIDKTEYTSWKIRVEKEKSPVNISGKTYNDVVRVDYFEGGTPLETTGLLRESWYFAKNVGVIKILLKHFNNYGELGTQFAKACSDDPDCSNDTIANPHVEVLLSKYYQNPQLEVQVSKDNSNYSSNTRINPRAGEGYYLKALNSDFTGYLEAKISNGRVFKWYWMENGVASVPASDLLNFPSGNSNTASFRVWVPNEQITGETRIGDTNIPWSNSITVVIE